MNFTHSQFTQPTQRTIVANGLKFSFLEMGAGPLALCLHGFPDTPMTWRYLMPALANKGYRVVAPYMRGYAPTEIPSDGNYSQSMLGNDINALHEALGGDESSILIGHDWGAIAAYFAAGQAPHRWSKVVTMSVPPMQVFGQVAFSYAQIKRSFYFWFFQMAVSNTAVAADDFAFIEGLWRDWSPGYQAQTDLEYVKSIFRSTESLNAALSYYRCNVAPKKFGVVMDALPVLTQPLLYLHGENDGCIHLSEDQVKLSADFSGPGSRSQLIPDVGHFITVEKPVPLNLMVLDFIES